jgi:dienelactone hydrolase
MLPQLAGKSIGESLSFGADFGVFYRPMYSSFSACIFCVLLLAGCAGTTTPTAPSVATTPDQSPAKVLKPEGNGPFPAVVVMHDCSGLGPRSSGAPMRWANELLKLGYVVALPDSFTARGFPAGVCLDASPNRNDVAPDRRVADAYATLAYLRTLPYVDGARVGIMGGSHGGSTTLASIVAPVNDDDPSAQAKRNGFKAAIALYPGCAVRYGDWRTVRPAAGSPDLTRRYMGVFKPVAPLLILTGEKDDWTPAEPCLRLVESARSAGYAAAIKIYPGAHHSFDSNTPLRYVASRVNGNSPTGRGATTGGDAQAWADSIREVTAFFAQHLVPH